MDLAENTFGVVEQLPFNTPANTTVISEMAPVKSSERTLPITPLVRPYFERHLELQKEQKRFAKQSGNLYFDNDLVFAKPNGSPKRRVRAADQPERHGSDRTSHREGARDAGAGAAETAEENAAHRLGANREPLGRKFYWRVELGLPEKLGDEP